MVFKHSEVESKWQERWVKKKIYQPDLGEPKKKFYNLMMFPYPSAEGLHAGNVFAFTGSDVYGRFKRMQGYDLFEPIGLDGFGIHSENYAIKVGISPQVHSKRSQENFYRQLHQIGNGFDWDHTLETFDSDFYKWTQWLFVQLFKAGLVYRKAAEINWCPSCKTVLADEQVVTPKAAGKLPKGFKSFSEIPEGVMVCERCGTIVVRKKLEQWFIRITKYANRLLDNLEKINWSERVKVAQTKWIGKKDGINITYQVFDNDLTIKCWTSRPDTNFGASFIVLSPDNPIINKLTVAKQKLLVDLYIREALSNRNNKQVVEKGKSGVFTGSFAINKLNGDKLPIYVSDFVIGHVGTGAVVGVPGHDKRDFEFAVKFKLPIKRVVVGPNGDKTKITKLEQVYTGEGTVINSSFLDQMHTEKARKKIIEYIVSGGFGEKETNYHIRDWLISRQRYWGPPIPMIHCQACAQHGEGWLSDHSDWESAGWWPEENLPILLPEIKDYLPKGTGRGPLADHPEFYIVRCPHCGADAKRETDVSDTFVDSSWYFLAYPNLGTKSWKKGSKITSDNMFYDKSRMEKWLPVDLYFGGAEHAVLHLMYARFVTMALHDLGILEFEEPFTRFFAHGLVIKDGAKMSKSKGNVVNPDDYIKKYGADTLRLYLMFMGPMDSFMDFRDTGIEGMRRFVERIWDLYSHYKDTVIINKDDAHEVLVTMHQTIKKVSEDIENFRYNTAISAIMELTNLLRDKAKKEASKADKNPKSNIRCAEWDQAIEALLKLIAPFAPHISEEIWVEILGLQFSIHASPWPQFEPEIIKVREYTIAIQVNGKVRDTLLVSSETASNKEIVVDQARKSEKVSKWLTDKSVKDTIFVPGKILNIVAE